MLSICTDYVDVKRLGDIWGKYFLALSLVLQKGSGEQFLLF